MSPISYPSPPVKYNSGTTLSYSISQNKISIGINDVDYGPTIQTGWVGNVVDYLGNPYPFTIISDTYSLGLHPESLATPTFWGTTGSTNTDLLNLINGIDERLNQTPFTNLSDAITWIEGTQKYLIQNRFYENIVTTNLRRCYDAGFTASYPLVNDAWYDISGNDVTVTLNNTVFDTDNGGIFQFNGTNANVPLFQPLESNTSYSINAWVLATTSSASRNICSSENSPLWINNGTLYGGVGGDYAVTSYPSFPINEWVNVCVTFDDGGQTMNLYVNGSLVDSNSTVSLHFIKENMYIGSHFNGSPVSFFEGFIGHVSIYDNFIDSNDVIQNYNSLAPRFSSSPLPTPTNTPSQTNTPTSTSSVTSTPTPTNTETPTNTPTPTNTITPTNTETPTNTPTSTLSVTSTPTPSVTPTNTLTPTNTVTSTNTTTPTNTPTVTPTTNIVTSGLIIQLDAYSSVSYPGTGTTVYDLTSSFNHTLTTAPYTVLNGIKCFDCNGAVNTNIRVNGAGPILPSSGYTYISWVRLRNDTSVYRTLYRAAPNDHPLLVAVGSNNLGFYDNNTSSFISAGYDVSPIVETWAQLTVVANSTGSTYYVNGTQVGVSVPYTAAGNRHDYWGSIPGQPSGYVANMYYYNRSLSLAEITQQYNYLAPRFVEPTPTPTTTSTPTVTPTKTITPTPTNTTTTTPTPTQTQQNFLLFEDGSIATAENNDNIQIDII